LGRFLGHLPPYRLLFHHFICARLEDAVAALQFLIGQIDGLRGAPTDPPEKITAFPFAVAFPTDGEWAFGDESYDTGLHTIVLQIHTARKDLPRDVAAIIPYGELVREKLRGGTNGINILLPDSAGSATVDTIDGLRYTFGKLNYEGIPTIGWSFEVDIKIEQATP